MPKMKATFMYGPGDVRVEEVERPTIVEPTDAVIKMLSTCRPGGYVGYVGVSHGVQLDGSQLFLSEVHLMGGPAPVRKYLPEFIDLIYKGEIHPGKVFTKTVDLDDIAEGYHAMDQREAIKVRVRP